ncbi:MAG: hypothetical protein ACRD0K_29690 [Egibacteraceae bacterium]
MTTDSPARTGFDARLSAWTVTRPSRKALRGPAIERDQALSALVRCPGGEFD